MNLKSFEQIIFPPSTQVQVVSVASLIMGIYPEA